MIVSNLHNKNKGLDCIICAFTMTGIYSYEIREACEPCGGKSLVKEEKNAA